MDEEKDGALEVRWGASLWWGTYLFDVGRSGYFIR
jgi:hypothetical protein